LDRDKLSEALALFTLQYYVASEVVQCKESSARARIFKAICAVELGYINEAYQLFEEINNLKNNPLHMQRQSLEQ